MTLNDVARAARAARLASDKVRQAVASAHTAGANITELAAAADVTRQTIYRWIAMETGESGGDPADVLRATLRKVASLVDDPYHAQQLIARADGTEQVLLNSMKMARAWLPSDAMDDEIRGQLMLASAAEDRLRRKR